MRSPECSPRYQRFVMVLCPLLNSVAGIVIDLYAPSLPAIGREFRASAVAMQATIVITTFGYAIGQLFFGALSDRRGRRPGILSGLALFCLASLLALGAQSLTVLLLARALQGFAVGSCQVVSRAVLIDCLSGRQFQVAVIYLSVAFALGLIVGPYVGGALQQAYGWRTNFIFYAAYGGVLLVAAGAGIRETLAGRPQRAPASLPAIYRTMLGTRAFSLSTWQLGLSFIGFTLWNQVGPYVVETRLGHGPRYFGATALTVGAAYLLGTLTNRLLVSVTRYRQRLLASQVVFALGAATIALSGARLQLLPIVAGVMLCTYSQGLIFPNVLSRALSFFPDRAGIAASLQGFGMLLVGSGGLALASLVTIRAGTTVALLYGLLCVVAVLSASINPPERDL